MKNFLHMKWLSIPVIVVLVLAITAGGVLAAYNFTGIGVEVEVDEPLQVQYNLYYVVHDTQNPEGRTDESGWLDADPTVVIPANFSAGDAQTLKLRMNNRANSTLTVYTLISGNSGRFVYDGTDFPQGQVIPASNGFDFGSSTKTDAEAADWNSGSIPISIKGDTAPGDYSLIIEFTRE